MIKKSTFTMACMLMTVGCANLQTNAANKGKIGERSNDDLSSRNNSESEDITIEIVGGKKEKIKKKCI